MNWTNLQTGHCPYDGGELMVADENKLTCKSCKFEIDKHRARRIALKRNTEPKVKVKIYWQNLRDSRCPICNSFLKEKYGKLAYYECIKDDCDFRIADFDLKRILADPEHPANKFYKSLAKI